MTQAELDLQTFLVDHVVPYVVQMRTDLTSAQQTIAQLRTDLGLKANATTVQQLSQRVGTAETTLDTKASTAYVDTKDQAISGINADQTQALAHLQQLLTTDEGVTQGILTTQSQHATTLAGLRADVDLKATASTVSSLQGQVTTVKNLVNDSVTGLTATNTLAAGAKTVADTTAAAVNNASTGLAATNTLAIQNAAAAVGLKKEVATRARTIRFLNVSSGSTLADLHVDANGVLVDYLGYPTGKIIGAVADVVTGNTLNTVITIKAAATTVLTTPAIAPALAVAGSLLNLLGMSTTTTAPVPFGSPLTATSSNGGTFNLTLTILPIQ